MILYLIKNVLVDCEGNVHYMILPHQVCAVHVDSEGNVLYDLTSSSMYMCTVKGMYSIITSTSATAMPEQNVFIQGVSRNNRLWRNYNMEQARGENCVKTGGGRALSTLHRGEGLFG